MEKLEQAIAEIKKALPGLEFYENEAMSAHCSFKTGGPARAFAVPSDETSFAKVCAIMKSCGCAPYVLGNGTNVVFPDEGTKDLLVISTAKLTKLFLIDENTIYAGAGVSMAKLAGFAQQNSLKGLEFASGIPGSVGGGTVMNAGAYGGELKDVIQSVVVYSMPDQTLYETDNERCAFAYRSSVFQKMGSIAIMATVFKLEKGDPEEIAAKMRELNERRRDKQPLDLPSAGSAFKRPEGYYAAALIEQAGLKGYACGGAAVSEKHAGFIVNKGGATSKDVYDCMLHVRNTVYEKTGVELEPEIILIPPEYRLEDNSPMTRMRAVSAEDGGATGAKE